MKREAWESMNNSLISKYKNNVNHQIISDGVVESLHEAGFVIVSRKATPAMQSERDGAETMDFMIQSHINNRQRSE